MKKILKNVISGLFIISLLSMVSCKDAEENTQPQAAQQENAVESSYLNKEESKDSEVVYNPAHGQPNHRCDLPVGAPLNQAKQQNTATSTSGNQSPVRLQSATPRINPPHGEPGHDCAVAVGAELR
ncbi:hypothetical protein RM549_13485 [Salegentibacter sp. F188]|uniref:Uncharacterized protein n=1 Tax=Autumnicola patrickiae TaxID=3075591 RepID=A0ABU3E4G7_9FLAO|nr:hypothetical protein [Salegentibacter sp. F188]MDT0690805.1 hypothetical protein [Salegentibacter sp. F188]